MTISSRRQLRQTAVRRLNAAIEQTLSAPNEVNINHLRQVCGELAPTPLAERVRRCAQRLVRRDPPSAEAILQARDDLILQVYAAAAPPGWYVGWSDGSSKSSGQDCTAGVGAILLDPQGQHAGQICRQSSGLDAFEAELAALQALVQLAIEVGAKRLRVHTDCVALVRLWCSHRNDPRLAALRDESRALRGYRLRSIPRAHNRPAHRLARQGLTVQFPRCGPIA